MDLQFQWLLYRTVKYGVGDISILIIEDTFKNISGHTNQIIPITRIKLSYSPLLNIEILICILLHILKLILANKSCYKKSLLTSTGFCTKIKPSDITTIQPNNTNISSITNSDSSFYILNQYIWCLLLLIFFISEFSTNLMHYTYHEYSKNWPKIVKILNLL